MKRNRLVGAMVLGGMMMAAAPAMADTCSQLTGQGLTHDALKAALQAVVAGDGGPGTPNGGSQSAARDIWLGSRVISAQKANTANSFSTGLLSLSTANLFAAVQPGGSLYGLQHSNPVDSFVAYDGDAGKFGTTKDPLEKQRVGGINVFGGGLTLYNSSKVKVGAIGVSGDTSCTDHVVAWKVRQTVASGAFAVANVPGGVANGGANDALIQDIVGGVSAGGFGHTTCLNNPTNTNDGDSIDGN